MYRIVPILFLLPCICIAQVSNPATVNIYGGARPCIGSLIHQRWILTAASCFAYRQPANYLMVNTGFNSYGVERAITHPNYVSSYPEYDIALLRLYADINEIRRTSLDINNALDYRGQTMNLNARQFPIVDESYCAGYTSNYQNLICVLDQSRQNCQITTGTPIFFNNRQIGLVTGTNQCGNQAGAFTRGTPTG